VPRQLAHRSTVCEVFLTDARQIAEYDFVVAAQLPRAHSFHNDQGSCPRLHDPLLLLELCRQAIGVVVHGFLGVSLAQRFLLTSAAVTITDAAALRLNAGPGRVVLSIELTEPRQAGRTLTGVTLRTRIHVDGREAGHTELGVRWMSSAVWARLRAGARHGLAPSLTLALDQYNRVEPGLVGRARWENVVLSAVRAEGADLVGTVLVDTGHPALFDHPLDHIPGSLLLEALRQTALATNRTFPARFFPTAIRARFIRFGEFELGADCRARSVTRDENVRRLDLSICQQGQEICSGEVEMSAVDSLLGVAG
jgi:2-oxo-3-(phosphooxy)propyl 3-oxoalkanoate synthase